VLIAEKTPHRNARDFGLRGEELVAQHLRTDGFSIVARNYRRQYGEIDIVASKDDLLLFVEVKARVASPFGMDHLVSPAKQRKLGMVAREFIVQHNVINKVCRFDVALLECRDNTLSLNYIDNAFSCDE